MGFNLFLSMMRVFRILFGREVNANQGGAWEPAGTS
jgi:hypothetical protein